MVDAIIVSIMAVVTFEEFCNKLVNSLLEILQELFVNAELIFVKKILSRNHQF